jgi:EmrB/QacA subfamily drug resistance transporter
MSTPVTLPTDPPRAASRRPGAILAIIVACQLMLAVDITVVTIALPRIQRELDFSPTDLSWVQNSYLLAFGGLLLLGGRAGDLFGRRRMFVGGVLVFTVASLLAGLATTAWWLIAARVLQGVGGAFAGPSTLALIATNFAEGPARTRALAWFSSLTGAGASIGLILGGALADWASWPWVFFVNLPIGIAIAVLAPRLIAEPERGTGRLDILGALTCTAGVITLVYGFIRVADSGWGDTWAVLSFAVALVLLALFVRGQRRSERPLMPVRLFVSRDRAAAFLATLFLVAGMFGSFFLLTQFLQDVRGYSPITAGLAFLPLTLGVFATLQAIPTLVARFGPRPVLITGSLLVTAGMAWLTGLSASTGYVEGLLGPMLLLGAGVGASMLPLNVIVLSSVRPEESGVASGLQQTMQWVGGSLGLSILVSVLGSVGRDAGPDGLLDAGITGAFTAAMIFAGCAVLVAVVGITTKRAASAAS